MKLLLGALLTGMAFGQIVTWNQEMGHVYQNGNFWFIGTSDTTAMVVSVADSGSYLTATLVIVNRSSHTLDILPERFTLTLTSPKRSKALEYVPPERVIGKLNRSVAWGQLSAELAAAGATRQETTTSTTSGDINATTVSTRQVPDEQKRKQIWEAQRESERRANEAAQSVATSAIRATTLGPGQECRGIVYFKRDKSCHSRSGCQVQLVVPIENAGFQFPVTFGMGGQK